MRQIGQFITSDKNQLSTQLSKLEQNIVKETADIRAAYDATPMPTPIVTKGGGTYTTGEALLADTSAGAFAVNLAAPADGKPARMIVINLSANILTLVPIAPALINLSTSFPASGGKFELFFDSVNWWL
jgi:hypothetical protein